MRSSLKIIKAPDWNFHRVGWSCVSKSIERFQNENGILFYEWVDGEFAKNVTIRQQWMGILHNVIDYPQKYRTRKDIRIICLRDLITNDSFLDSIEKCLCLFTLSKNTARFLKEHGVNAIPLLHPAKKIFDWNGFQNKIVIVGQWMRDFDSMSLLKSSHEKIVLKVPWQQPYEGLSSDDFKFIDYASEEAYDDLLSKSVVFIHMYDISACNTILECIMNNVPVLTNRLPASEEYLGKDYPLFYESIDEVNGLLTFEKISETNNYLKNKDKHRFELEYFCNELDSFTRKAFLASSVL